MTLLLDTHVWIWWLTGSAALPARERIALDGAASRGGIRLSAISVWEVEMLQARGRLVVPVPFDDWLRLATAPEVLEVLPIDVDVVIALRGLPASFHGDPADRIVVATARAHGLPVATHDRAIRRSRAARIWRP